MYTGLEAHQRQLKFVYKFYNVFVFESNRLSRQYRLNFKMD